MKKLFCMLIALVLAVSLAVPAFAAEKFVPSITYKDGPDVESGTMNGEKVTTCLVVTSISEAKNKSTDITQAERDLLLDVYKQLNNGTMKLPIANDKNVIRELVDVSFSSTGCVAKHDHAAWLATAGNTATVDFDLGVKSSTEVTVMIYKDGKWAAAEKVTNLGNGTVRVVFEDVGIFAFCVSEDSQVTPPQTGDTAGSQLFLWGTVMAGSVAALLILLVVFKRAKGDEGKQ